MKIDELPEKIRNKIINKQKNISTDIDLSNFCYKRKGKKHLNVSQLWCIFISKEKSLVQKIANRQRYINSDADLSQFDYYRTTKPHGNKKQQWVLKSYGNKIKKCYRENLTSKQKTEYREYGKRYYYEHHKEKLKWYYDWRNNNRQKVREANRKYNKSIKGKISDGKKHAKRDKKGFVLLFELENIGNIEIDYHHVSKDMPFVIPVPRSIHRSIGGEKHYLEVTTKFCKWLKEHPEVSIRELIK